MTIVIGAIYQNKTAYITADTKANSKSGVFIYNNVEKVFQISHNSIIGIAGDYQFAKSVVEHMEGNANNTRELLLDIATSLKIQNTKWLQKYHYQFEATFMLGGHLQDKPYMLLVLFHQGKISIYEEPFEIGDYQYFLINPSDLQFESCRDLCERILSDTKPIAPQKRLEQVVKSVSAYSDLVNDQPLTMRVG